jgi:hypothetical protein
MNKEDWLMLSDKGNLVISSLVSHARQFKWTWPECLARLHEISQSGIEGLDPAFDTVVRERVYQALGYTTDFYEDYQHLVRETL